MTHRSWKTILLCAALVAVVGCRSSQSQQSPPVTTAGIETLLLVQHPCLPGFEAIAGPLELELNARTGEMGKGWARRLKERGDFDALECLCTELSVALGRRVGPRSYLGGNEALHDLADRCGILLGILQDDRPSHLDPALPGWLKRPLSDPEAIEDAETLFRAAKDALDM